MAKAAQLLELRTAAFALVDSDADQAHPSGPAKTLELVLTSGERFHIPADAATLRIVLSALRKDDSPGT